MGSTTQGKIAKIHRKAFHEGMCLHYIKNFSVFVLIMVGLILVAGCGTSDGMRSSSPERNHPIHKEFIKQAQLNPLQLSVGDTFSFDNPTVTWRVVAVEDARILWKSDLDEEQATSFNPLLPALSWTSSQRGKGTRLLSNIKGDLFPLKKGNVFSFIATVDTDQPPYAWEYNWQCETERAQMLTTSVGEFLTYKIACGRDGKTELIFHYAPEIGYYVQMDIYDLTNGKVITRQMTAFNVAAYTQNQQAIAMAMAESGKGNDKRDKASSSRGDQPGFTPSQNQNIDTTQGYSLQTQPQDEPPMATGASSTQMQSPSSPQIASNFWVHLASYKSRANVMRGWQLYMSRLPNEMAALTMEEVQVTLDGKGQFYRLFASGFPDQVAADNLCRTLKTLGLFCRVVQR